MVTYGKEKYLKRKINKRRYRKIWFIALLISLLLIIFTMKKDKVSTNASVALGNFTTVGYYNVLTETKEDVMDDYKRINLLFFILFFISLFLLIFVIRTF